MIIPQDFHLAMDFTNDNGILETLNVRMAILSMNQNPSLDGERNLTNLAVHPERGDAKEGRDLVGHSFRKCNR